jgi:hypothetical protein
MRDEDGSFAVEERNQRSGVRPRKNGGEYYNPRGR